MTLTELYSAIEGNYDEVLNRMRREQMITKFVIKFLNDTSFDLLVKSIADKDTEKAFMAAHTLKGICQNLSFERLSKSTEKITEALRNGQIEEAITLLPQVEEDYKLTSENILIFSQSQEA